MIERYGNLIVPTESQIHTFEDNEFGMLHIVKYKTPLYTTVPPVSIRQRSPKRLISLGKKVYPAIQVNEFNSETVGVYTELQANQEVLARKIAGCDDVYEIVTFESTDEAREDMPETGDGIKIISKGYVLAKDLTSTQNPTHFKVKHSPIFINEDLTKDIRQNSFGDCFLLSSVLAILGQNDGSSYIRSMMIQDGDYTVVRLYDPNTFEPVYVRVKNSLYIENNDEVITHKALWVHILEKAYTAFAFKKDGDQIRSSFPSFREMYGNGGSTAVALSILTGKAALKNKIERQSISPWQIIDWMLCANVFRSVEYIVKNFTDDSLDKLDAFLAKHSDQAFLGKLFKELCDHQDKPLQERIDNLLSLINDNEFAETLKYELKNSDDKNALLNDLICYVDKYKQNIVLEHEPITEVFKNIRQMAEAGEYARNVIMQGKISEFTQLVISTTSHQEAVAYLNAIERFDPPAPENVLRLYHEFISTKKYWDLPVGTNEYAKEVDELFNDLSYQFNINKTPIIVSTKQKFLGKVAGLRPQHAYAVTDIFERECVNGAKAKFIKIRNPWGHTGRQTDLANKAKLEARNEAYITEVKDAEFAVELSDFMQHFSAYTIGEFSQSPALKPQQQVALLNNAVTNDVAIANSSFLNRHGYKILIGLGISLLLTILAIATFGIGPLIVGIAGLITFASLHVIAGVTACAITLLGAGFGALVGAISGVISDSIEVKKEKYAYKIDEPNLDSRNSSEESANTSSEEESASEEVRSSSAATNQNSNPHINFRGYNNSSKVYSAANRSGLTAFKQALPIPMPISTKHENDEQKPTYSPRA